MDFDHVEIIFIFLVFVHVLLENADLPQNLMILILKVGKPICGLLRDFRNNTGIFGVAQEYDRVENLEDFPDLVRSHYLDSMSAERWFDDGLQNVVKYVLDF